MTAETPPSSNAFRRRGTVSVSAAVVRAALPHLRRRGLGDETLFTHWADIMGPLLAERTAPERLVRSRDGGPGVLHLVVSSGGVGAEIQHLSPQIIERINAYLGRPAVGRLALRHGSVERSPPRRRRRIDPPLTGPERERLDCIVGPETDERVRAALLRLGEAVLRRNEKRDAG